MNRLVAVAAIGIVALSASPALAWGGSRHYAQHVPRTAQAQADPLCEAFRRNPDGSWTSVKPVTVETPSIKLQVAPGQTFNRGAFLGGIDIVDRLEKNCGAKQ